MKIVTIVGARPQFVKAAVVSRAIDRSNRIAETHQIDEILLHTGQHYDKKLSDVFFEELEIPKPRFNLNVGSGAHGKMTGEMLARIESVLFQEKPAAVVVYGDTNSTLAGALAAAKLNIPVAHVEAGLRSFNRRMPEEINRCVTDHVADLLFCPTQTAVDNLQNEGISEGVFHVGDVMYDAARYYMRKTEPIDDKKGPFFLATIHRAENTDAKDRLKQIFDGLASCKYPVLLPLHPRTRKALMHQGLSVAKHIKIVEPLPYLSLIAHLMGAEAVITDSGGLQKEAFFFKKKCLTLRDETEWVELVEIGANKLVGANADAIRGAMEWAMVPLGSTPALYGTGNSAEKIVEILAERIMK